MTDPTKSCTLYRISSCLDAIECRANDNEALVNGPKAFVCQYDLDVAWNIESFPERYSSLSKSFTLQANDYLQSKNGVYKLFLENDGNLALYV